MSRHKIFAYLVAENWETEYVITFEFRRGAPEKGPSYSSGGQPAEPDEVEFVSISPGPGDQGASSDISQADLEAWAREWLDGEGCDEVRRVVAADQEDAQEAAAAHRADDARERWAREDWK